MKAILVIWSIIVTATVLVLGGCSAVFSSFDKVTLVHRHTANIAYASTPNGFVVSPQEIKKVVPITKYAWNIYADRDSYYLSSAIQKFTSKTGDNSWLAKQNGIRISGTSRSDIEKLRVLASNNFTGRIRSPKEMRAALGQEP